MAITVEPVEDGCRITTIAIDRVGLLADFAAMLALQRIPVRAARVWAQGEYGVSVWEVGDEALDPAILRTKFEASWRAASTRPRASTPRRPGSRPTVVVRPEASDQATVLEVRAADRPGVVYLVCRALAALDVTVRSAHLDTLGPQAVDVFYLQESSAGALSETRAAEAAHAVRAVLAGASGLPAGDYWSARGRRIRMWPSLMVDPGSLPGIGASWRTVLWLSRSASARARAGSKASTMPAERVRAAAATGTVGVGGP